MGLLFSFRLPQTIRLSPGFYGLRWRILPSVGEGWSKPHEMEGQKYETESDMLWTCFQAIEKINYSPIQPFSIHESLSCLKLLTSVLRSIPSQG